VIAAACLKKKRVFLIVRAEGIGRESDSYETEASCESDSLALRPFPTWMISLAANETYARNVPRAT